jgi:predicted Zn-dependent protease with MMP-like domain
MDAETFDRCVEEAFDALPEDIVAELRNVEITTEDWPDKETMQLARVRFPSNLLGFYHGVPLTQRGQGYHMVLPDRITLYREPILRKCATDERARELIAHVLRHEIAHYFGISDKRLRQLGAY